MDGMARNACAAMLAAYVPGFSALHATLAPLGASVELATTHAQLPVFDDGLLIKLRPNRPGIGFGCRLWWTKACACGSRCCLMLDGVDVADILSSWRYDRTPAISPEQQHDQHPASHP